MRSHKVLVVFAAALFVSLAPTASSAAGVRSVVTPATQIGPQAIPAATATPNYGLFTCQIIGLDPGVTCYDPYQMRHAYNVDTLIHAGLDGRGKTIVIIDAYQDPYLAGDVSYFNSFYGLPSFNAAGGPSFTQVAPDGLGPFDSGWAGEMTLDVEWAHAIAPAANIVLVLAKSANDNDILSATQYAIDNSLGDVISQSFGENESCASLLAQQHQLFAEATMKNITLFASSGDNGAAQGACDSNAAVQAVSSPASDPLVTAVGGTELHAARYCLAVLGCDPSANPAAGTYQGEIVWNEAAFGFGASGGGFSVVYDEPSYQNGTIHGGKQRGVPDVSYNAAVYHGVLLRLFGSWYLSGGTSAGSPQWAAITAIADQNAGYDLGFINKALYHIGQAQSHYSASFFDVVSGNNSYAGVTGFNAGPGWDPATGLGSPSADQLVSYLKQFVSAGDGTAAIAGSAPHGQGNASAPGQMKPH
jgi:subtilase family serine protease